MTQGTRVTLTKAHLSTKEGGALRDLLGNIAEDGALTDEEISELARWLKETDANVPAVAHLRDTLIDILRDGVVSDDERKLLFRQIERVLPKEDREEVQFARRSRVTVVFERDDDPTDAQVRYIVALGGSLPSGATRATASEIIDELLNTNASITPRQWMVIRFWGKTLPAEWGRRHVSEWMDEMYSTDPDTLTAWSIFKEENGDGGTLTDPLRVPYGVGPGYLARVRGYGAAAGPVGSAAAPEAESESKWPLVIIILVIVAVAAIASAKLK